jgi:hypothetical protein
MGRGKKANVSTIVIAATYNNTFNKIYHEFENKIFFKINHKDPVYQSWGDYIASGFTTKPTYFLGATYYMRMELSIEHVYQLRDALFAQFFPIIKEISPTTLDVVLRSLLEALSDKILQLDVVTFDELMNINYRDLLLESKPFLKACKDDEALMSMLQNLTQHRQASLPELQIYTDKLAKSRATLFKSKAMREEEYKMEIESEFVMSGIKISP